MPTRLCSSLFDQPRSFLSVSMFSPIVAVFINVLPPDIPYCLAIRAIEGIIHLALCFVRRDGIYYCYCPAPRTFDVYYLFAIVALTYYFHFSAFSSIPPDTLRIRHGHALYILARNIRKPHSLCNRILFVRDDGMNRRTTRTSTNSSRIYPHS